MPLETPKPIRMQHEQLRDLLVTTAHGGGRVGATAQRVKRLLEPHMAKEERCAMPLLGLLVELARSGTAGAVGEASTIAEELQAEYQNLLSEHRMIAAAIDEMLDAAKAEDRPDCADVALQILNHAYLEESVLYPAAMLAGQQLKRRRP